MLQIQILNKERTILETSGASGDGVALVYLPPYSEGDHIVLTVGKEGLYDIQLDEALGKHTVYIKDTATYVIPLEEEKQSCFPQQAFSGGGASADPYKIKVAGILQEPGPQSL